jgi:hypothetical protein
MATIRTLAAHEVVRAVFPRPVTEADELGMAVGKAIDETLSHFCYEVRAGRRPTFSSMQRYATEVLDREIADSDLSLEAAVRRHELESVFSVVRAFRRTDLMGLARPRSRLIVIGEGVGVYAQPDYWDGRDRFYEMKSYLALPPPPDVELQVRLFQLAFPGFRSYLACFDRHADPVTTTVALVPELSEERRQEVLRLAYRTGVSLGAPKVLEYLDAPTVRYPLPSEPGPPRESGS